MGEAGAETIPHCLHSLDSRPNVVKLTKFLTR